MQTIDQAAASLETGKTTVRDLIEAALARIADPVGQGKATFIHTYTDQARAMADAADALRRANRAPSRYAGIPVSIKDLFDMAGEPTSAGSTILADAPPATTTAPAIARLLQAGLIPIGRTNMTEFAFSGVGINPHYGTPLSPWDRAIGHIPGGSSSGAAVSVADGMAFAGIGTDTGGSCRIPAALCGITGYKPTARRVPRAGVLPLAPSLDSVGPLAATAADCALIDAIMAGEPDRELPSVRLPGLRLLLPINMMLDNLDSPTEAALDRAVDRLDRAGVAVDRAPLRALDSMMQANATGGLAAAEALAWHRATLDRAGACYDQRVASRILAAATMPAEDYIRLFQARAGIIAAFEREVCGYDALLMPTVPIAPPPLSAFAEDADYRRLNFLLLRNPSAINFLDGCAISLPCHTPGAPPAGLMLAATAMQDTKLLAIAVEIQSLLTP
jgi:aspartyl-tRNA(Asn)/glutamyl-tRNA(Gln) amidotransferase subunit A